MITKLTEDHYGPLGTRSDAVFKGLEILGSQNNLVRSDRKNEYKLEFVGDSLTSAFGDMSGKNP